MKFPSIIRLPQSKKFAFTPRYYDPIKEEIAERTERIKKEMAGKPTLHTETSRGFIYERRSKSIPQGSYLQIIIAAVLGSLTVGWLYLGNQMFYYFGWAAVLFYAIYRFRKLNRAKYK